MAELDDDDLKDWKLKLRYGRLVTPYVHRTLIADVTVHETTEVNNAPPGPAVMGCKVWATDNEEAFDMARFFAREFGAETTGKIELYETEPTQPPKAKPYGYDINFHPYSEDT